jgi:DNA-3-methyladenine glycosylase I
MQLQNLPRCPWAGNDRLMIAYHDHEWGVPCYDDHALFERLILETFQAGLSWRTILHKRTNFRQAFDQFDPERIASYSSTDVERLLSDAGIVRNRLKITATIHNAQAFLKLRSEDGSFSDFVWSFVDHQPLRHPRGFTMQTLPTHTPESDVLSRALKQRGFTFVGSTICYAFMQSVGIVDDHVVGCFKFVRRNV